MEKPNIKTQDDSDTFVNTRSLCLICKKHTTKYMCPKCNLPYCSLDCYKKHSEHCTESFYRENVVDVMKGQRASAGEQLQMAKILRRVHEQNAPIQLEDLSDSEESDEGAKELLEKLASLDFDDPATVAKLTKNQLEEFHKFVAEGKMSTILEHWEPWWKASVPTSKIQVLDDDDAPRHPDFPAIKQDIPALSTLLRVQPSPLIMFSLLDVLYAYSFTKRLYNGDWTADLHGVISALLSVSDVLTKNTIHGSATQTASRSLELSLQPHVENTLAFSISVMDDVLEILRDKSKRLAALSDLWRYLEGLLVPTPGKTIELSKIQKKVAIAEKKVLFLLPWTNEQTDELFAALCVEYTHEIQTRRESLGQGE